MSRLHIERQAGRQDEQSEDFFFVSVKSEIPEFRFLKLNQIADFIRNQTFGL